MDLILDKLIDLKADGTFRLDMSYFNYCTGLTMTNDKFAQLFGGPVRAAETEITQREMDLAASIQKVTEIVVMRLAETLHRETGADYLCLAGGVALNCVMNGLLLRNGPFKDIWIQPAAGDAGGALGAASVVWHHYKDGPRTVDNQHDLMTGAYLGPKFTPVGIKQELDAYGAVYQQLPDEELFPRIARILADENVVGMAQGRMEFGPRALGGRSIIGDPRSPKMQSVMNLKIKYRESFRPFAPAVLAEQVSDYFIQDRPSPYMLIVADVVEGQRIAMTQEQQQLFGIAKLNVPRSRLPAITHVDYSARIQTVHRETNPYFHRVLTEFHKKTGCGVLVNTSFNVRGEPIVMTADDAYRCFMRTEMDYLIIDNFLLAKSDQPRWQGSDDWKDEFELD